MRQPGSRCAFGFFLPVVEKQLSVALTGQCLVFRRRRAVSLIAFSARWVGLKQTPFDSADNCGVGGKDRELLGIHLNKQNLHFALTGRAVDTEGSGFLSLGRFPST